MSKEQIKAARRKQAGNYAFLAPAAIIYLSVIVIPLIYSIYISFHKWNGVKAMEPVGIANYIRLFTEDDVFKTAFRNNLVWILLSVVVATALALAFALVLVKKFRGRTFFRGVFYFPCVVAPIAVAIIWRWMYNADFGFINSLMEALGIDYAQTWLSNPKTSLLALFAAALWQMVGEPMIFFLAGLQAVPSELYDAALVDGATPAQKFFYVTLPMIKETFVIVIATLVINAVHVCGASPGSWTRRPSWTDAASGRCSGTSSCRPPSRPSPRWSSRIRWPHGTSTCWAVCSSRTTA